MSIFKSLKNKLFGKSVEKEDKPEEYEKRDENPTASEASDGLERATPYLIQIGYDFGTSFSKCIYREDIQRQAWVYTSDKYNSPEQPFLLPSTVIGNGSKLIRHFDTSTLYPAGGLYHIKFAIEKVALGDWDAAVLNGYKNALGDWDANSLKRFVENCAIFFLASTLYEIQQDIHGRFSDFGSHPSDLMRVNMAIPVADIEQEEVKDLYNRILEEAWALAPSIGSRTEVELSEMEHLRSACETQSDLCFVYPEVSANVQAFIRSPAANPNQTTIYLFSDAGAGTVDQSVFTYTRHNSKLNYFAANVWPIGSSHIELKAAQHDKPFTLDKMEFWRIKKENDGDGEAPLQIAKSEIEHELAQSTYQTIEETKEKLPEGPNVNPVETLKANSRIIFGGGGHIDNPYKSGVVKAYGQDSITPQVTAIRTPDDLILNDHQKRWWPRLYVSYGLSFLPENLTGITLPPENKIPTTTVTQKRWVRCTCRGNNPSCYRCDGFGAYQEDV
jgi:hypothetical protein